MECENNQESIETWHYDCERIRCRSIEVVVASPMIENLSIVNRSLRSYMRALAAISQSLTIADCDNSHALTCRPLKARPKPCMTCLPAAADASSKSSLRLNSSMASAHSHISVGYPESSQWMIESATAGVPLALRISLARQKVSHGSPRQTKSKQNLVMVTTYKTSIGVSRTNMRACAWTIEAKHFGFLNLGRVKCRWTSNIRISVKGGGLLRMTPQVIAFGFRDYRSIGPSDRPVTHRRILKGRARSAMRGRHLA